MSWTSKEVGGASSDYPAAGCESVAPC
jgi:hypothetical protein